MKITLTNLEIENILSTIVSLENKDMKISIAHKLGAIQISLEKFYEKYASRRKKIVDDHSEKDDDGKPIKPKDKDGNVLEDRIQIKDVNAFQKDIDELLEQKVKVELPVTLSLEDFPEDVDVTIKQIRSLDPILSEKA